MKHLIRILLCLTLSATASGGSLNGRIQIPGSSQPLRILIKLSAPRSSRLPQEITASDARGNYSFVNLLDGPYMLEMYQGARLVRRQVIDIRGDIRLDFTLQAAGR